jgi:hypothetical protein
VKKDRSTLFTSPVSFADFVFRLAFFSLAPFAIVAAAELFPVRGALIDVGLALGVFVAGEAAKTLASRSRFVKFLISEALTFESFYREEMPRPFAYYFFYPLLFPYWLTNKRARREFLVFRSYTLGSFLILLGSLTWQFFTAWRPELGFVDFLPSVGLALAVETLLVLSLLMPIATTVVWYHSSFRRGRLTVVLLAGLVSTSFVIAHVVNRKKPIVSYSTRDRVRLRTASSPRTAHRTLVAAARAGWRETVKMPGRVTDGKIDGMPLDVARARLEAFYKNDEAAAFNLWGSPLRNSGVSVLYFEARPGKPPIWVGIAADGQEIKKRSELPKAAIRAMRRSDDDDDDSLPVWPEDIDLPGP